MCFASFGNFAAQTGVSICSDMIMNDLFRLQLSEIIEGMKSNCAWAYKNNYKR